MLGIYFSGTGNTRYCVETFLKDCDPGAEAVSIEDPRVEEKAAGHRELVFGYPVQYSSLPRLVHDFILSHPDLWRGRRIFVIATMGLFSGDGAGVAARLLRRMGAEITGGLHLKMPDSICDVKALKRTREEDRTLIRQAEEKLRAAAARLAAGDPPQEGLGPLPHLAGLLGQRLYFGHMTKRYTDRLKIDAGRCVGCGVCADLCPTKNIVMQGGSPHSRDACTMCYRCANHCPGQAITLLGRTVVRQTLMEGTP